MSNTIKLLVWLNMGKLNKKGLAPIFVRITINGNKTEIASGYFIKPDYWNSNMHQVKKECPEAASLNNLIDTIKAKVIGIHNQLLATGEAYTIEMLKSKYLGIDKKERTLLEAITYHNTKMQEQIGKHYVKLTYDGYCFMEQKIIAFLHFQYRKKDLPLKDLDHQFLLEFEHYLKMEEKNKQNTVLKYITKLKKIIHMAVNLDWMPKDPFRNFRGKKEEPERTYLTDAELSAFSSLSLPSKKLQRVRDLFIFQCYTGIAHADLQALTKDNLMVGPDKNPWIVLFRRKTGTRSVIPLLPAALEIISKYEELRETTGKLLPVLSNQKMNDYIREITTLCG
jgi:integrase